MRLMGDRLTVRLRTLNPSIGVRIPVSQPLPKYRNFLLFMLSDSIDQLVDLSPIGCGTF
jgi:hypothetical protein